MRPDGALRIRNTKLCSEKSSGYIMGGLECALNCGFYWTHKDLFKTLCIARCALKTGSAILNHFNRQTLQQSSKYPECGRFYGMLTSGTIVQLI